MMLFVVVIILVKDCGAGCGGDKSADKDASGEVERGGVGGELDRGQEVSEQVWKQVSDHGYCLNLVGSLRTKSGCKLGQVSFAWLIGFSCLAQYLMQEW